MPSQEDGGRTAGVRRCDSGDVRALNRSLRRGVRGKGASSPLLYCLQAGSRCLSSVSSWRGRPGPEDFHRTSREANGRVKRIPAYGPRTVPRRVRMSDIETFNPLYIGACRGLRDPYMCKEVYRHKGHGGEWDVRRCPFVEKLQRGSEISAVGVKRGCGEVIVICIKHPRSSVP